MLMFYEHVTTGWIKHFWVLSSEIKMRYKIITGQHCCQHWKNIDYLIICLLSPLCMHISLSWAFFTLAHWHNSVFISNIYTKINYLITNIWCVGGKLQQQVCIWNFHCDVITSCVSTLLHGISSFWHHIGESQSEPFTT